MGMAGGNTLMLENKVNSMFSKAEEMKPQIVVANMG